MVDFHASHRYAKITARKARLVIDLVRGLPVNQALVALDRSPKRAAVLVKKIVRSAVANAEQATNGSVDLNDLVVSEALPGAETLPVGNARVDALEWDEPTWVRDRAVLDVAGKARQKRYMMALETH